MTPKKARFDSSVGQSADWSVSQSQSPNGDAVTAQSYRLIGYPIGMKTRFGRKFTLANQRWDGDDHAQRPRPESATLPPPSSCHTDETTTTIKTTSSS